MEMKIHQPVRVLHFTSRLNIGGVQSFLLNYAEHINTEQIVFDYVVQTNEESEYDKRVKSEGSQIYSVTPMTVSNIRYIKDVYKLLKAHPEYKIVHAHLNFRNMLPLFAAKIAGVKVRISHSHSNYETTNFLKKILRCFFRLVITTLATDYYACSESAGVWLYGNKKGERKINVVHNAIQASDFLYSQNVREAIRFKNGWNDKFVWIHVGMFGKAKNHEFLIKLFRHCKKNDKNAMLILCGDGPERRNVEDMIVNYKMEDSVRFLGTINNVNELFMAADLMVYPSLYEGLPLACVEAQATGCPCVISSAVPEETVFNCNVKKCFDWSFCSWEQCIEGVKNKQLAREVLNAGCRKAGYDITVEANELMQRYLELYGKV